MAEAIHCPSCSTRYRLRPERVRPTIRRAQCFTCSSTFPVGDVVQRLLTEDAEASVAESVSLQAQPTEATPPSLTLGDLEDVDAEILEKTLVDAPAVLPETKPEPSAFPPEITEATLSGYTSARDAIEKLFGDSPALVSGLKVSRDPSAMDVEATLTALEETLGGSSTPPSVPSIAVPEDSPTNSGAATHSPSVPTPTTLPDAPASTTTVRLSREEVMAAMAGTTLPPPASSAPGATTPLRPADLLPAAATEATVALRPGDLMEDSPHARTQMLPAPPAQLVAAQLTTMAEAELLRLKIGDEIYPGLSMAQLTDWVLEGRILEDHLVARQFSENWLEAHKVPGLRPVFDRLRRERDAALGVVPTGDHTPVGLDTAPIKKSLFGGLFGAKN